MFFCFYLLYPYTVLYEKKRNLFQLKENLTKKNIRQGRINPAQFWGSILLGKASLSYVLIRSYFRKNEIYFSQKERGKLTPLH